VPALTAQGADVRLPMPPGLGYAKQVAWLKALAASVHGGESTLDKLRSLR